MRQKDNTEEILIFSFVLGVLAFFALKERRIDTFRKNLHANSPTDNLKKDWIKVGKDFSKSFKSITNR